MHLIDYVQLLEEKRIKSTEKLLAKGTSAIHVIYFVIIIDIIIQCRTTALLFWQKCFKAAGSLRMNSLIILPNTLLL
jgi:hypothetical protein